LVVLGIRPDAKKEIIDFRLAPGESALAWEALFTDLYRRGLKGTPVPPSSFETIDHPFSRSFSSSGKQALKFGVQVFA